MSTVCPPNSNMPIVMRQGLWEESLTVCPPNSKMPIVVRQTHWEESLTVCPPKSNMPIVVKINLLSSEKTIRQRLLGH